MKEKVLQVSWEKFRKQGFKAVKMDDIAHGLGISKRTLYEIYPNKEEILYESIQAFANRQIEHIKNRTADGDVMDIFSEFFRLHLKSIRSTNPLLVVEIKGIPRIKALMEEGARFREQKMKDFITRGQTEGYFISDVNTELYQKIHNLINDSISETQSYAQFSPDELFRTMVILMIRSICTQKGIQRLDSLLQDIFK